MKKYLTTKARRHQEGGEEKTAGDRKQKRLDVFGFVFIALRAASSKTWCLGVLVV